MSAAACLTFAIVIPALAASVMLVLPRSAVFLRVLLAAAAMAASLAAVATHAAWYGTGSAPVGWAWMPQLHLDFKLAASGLSTFFALLIPAVGFLIAIYARAYFGDDPDDTARFYPLLLLFTSAMIGVVLADNFLLLLLFWELTSLTSFFLIGWDRHDPAAVKKANQALIVTAAGGLCLMAGLILLGSRTDCWGFFELQNKAFAGSNLVLAACALIFAGAAAKSAQWPLHFWLPGAMAAPTPVSAFLHSATMVKAGVFLVAKFLPIFAVVLEENAFYVVAILGAITMLVGAYLALRNSDLKLIFACATVSQLGLLMAVYALGSINFRNHPAIYWDLSQILSHALYKAPLFVLAGAIAHVVGTRQVVHLRGLLRRGGVQSLLAVLLLAALYAMAAGPGTLAFAAKELFLYGAHHAAKASTHWVPAFVLATAAVVAAINVAVAARIAFALVARPNPHATDAPDAHHHHAPHGFWGAMLWLPAAILLAAQYTFGLAPQLLEHLISPLETNTALVEHIPSLAHAVLHPGLPTYISLAALVAGLLVALLPLRWSRLHDPHDGLYPAFYALATRGGARAFSIVGGIDLRVHVAVLCLAAVAIAWFSAYVAAAKTGSSLAAVITKLPLVWEGVGNLTLGLVLTVLVCLSAILLPVVKDRASRVMVLGTAGFAVAGVFYLYQAPDLALTQIAIEIVSLILFLLVLSLLPATPPSAKRTFLPRAVVAVAVGVTVAYLTYTSSVSPPAPLAYQSTSGQPFAHLGEFFLRNTYVGRDTGADSPPADFAAGHTHPGGGGNNAVNVILVDFRGFDTLGEITVLALAALGVWTLLPHAPRKSPQPDYQQGLSTVILRAGTRILIPLSLAFAAFIYFKGHQSPGGGFVAGLVAAVALIVQRMTLGPPAQHRLLVVHERVYIAGGLTLALLSAVVPLVLQQPFMHSAYGYLPLPFSTPLHLASVMVFDLGVFVLVTGVVTAMINALSHEAQ